MTITELKSLLPENLQNGVVRYETRLYSFLYFVEKFEKNRMNLMTPEEFSKYLIDKYSKHVVVFNKERYINRVMKELKSSENFVAEIDISKDVKIDIEGRLREWFENADDEFLVPFGNTKKNIYEIYEILKKNKYVEFSIEEKRELLNDMLNRIDDSIRKSIIEEVGLSVEDFIINQIPHMMINTTQVKIADEVIDLTEVIKRIADIQFTRQQEKKEDLDRTKENPSLVTEIGVELNPSSELETTLELPIILKENEIASLEENHEYSKPERYYINQLRRLSDAIVASSKPEDLEILKQSYFDFKNEFTEVSNEYIKLLLQEIETEIIPKRERELHILKNNAEDYVDVIVGKIRELKNTLSVAETETEFIELQKEIDKLDFEVSKRVSNDNDFSEAHASLNDLKYLLAEKQKLMKLVPNNSVINKIVEKLIDLKHILLNIEYNSNKAKTVGYSIKFEYAKSELYNDLNNSYQMGLISEDEYQELLNQINQMEMLEKKSSVELG